MWRLRLPLPVWPASPQASIARSVRNFKAVEHRLEPVAEIKGVHFFNDSKATNVDATIKALEAFESGVILILGGRDKGGDFKVLSHLLQQRAKSVILLGEASDKIRTQLAGTVPMTQAHSMDDAVRLAVPAGCARKHGFAGAGLRQL